MEGTGERPVITGLESQQTKMAFAFTLLGTQVYGGTVTPAEIARRRKKNKRARAARMAQRKAGKK